MLGNSGNDTITISSFLALRGLMTGSISSEVENLLGLDDITKTGIVW